MDVKEPMVQSSGGMGSSASAVIEDIKGSLIIHLASNGTAECSYSNRSSGSAKSFSKTLCWSSSSSSSSSYSPSNRVSNQKYSIWSFLPLFFYQQFRFFFNLYFLIVGKSYCLLLLLLTHRYSYHMISTALSQFIPILQIGFLFTYVAPLAFVLFIAMLKVLFHIDSL